MNRSLTARIMNLLKRRHLKKTLAKIAMVLSCMAIFLITYMLIAPVLTQEWVAECGKAEHTHTEACYTQIPVETAELGFTHTHSDACYSRVRVENPCPVPEHVHTDGCYTNARGESTCGKAEHVHTDGCYMTVRGENVCGKEEHLHAAGCWDAAGNLICTAEEHTHDDSCFEVKRELTCTAEEHIHDDRCFPVERTLTCAMEEHVHSDDCYSICGSKAHTHSEGCFDAAGSLICGTAEHTHTDDCFTYENVLTCGLEETAAPEPEMKPVLTCGIEEHTHTNECYPVGEKGPDYKCGFLTEHTHTGDCYFEDGTLKCTIPEHVHDDSCLLEKGPEQPNDVLQPDVPEAPVTTPEIPNGSAGEAPVYTCGFPTEHTHSESCYENGVLKCTIPEHVHDESCLPVYTCGQTAHVHSGDCPGNGALCIIPEHVHDDSCMPDYACGQSAHTHDESCYDANGLLTCTRHVHDGNCLPAYTCGRRAHTHDNGCYDTNGVLICTIAEHAHNENCLPKTTEAPGEGENPIEPVQPVAPVTPATPDEGYICGFRAHTHSSECYEMSDSGDWLLDETGARKLKCGLEEHEHTENCLPKQTPVGPQMPNGPVVIAGVQVPADYTPIDVWSDDSALFDVPGSSLGIQAQVYAPADAFAENVVFVPTPLYYEEKVGETDVAEALTAVGVDSNSIVTAMDLSFVGTESYGMLEPQNGPVFVKLTMPMDLSEGAELKLWHQISDSVMEEVADAHFKNENGTLTVEFRAYSFSTYAITTNSGEGGTVESSPVSWGATVPYVAPSVSDGVTTWDVSAIQYRYLDIPVRINVSGLKPNSTITLPYALDIGDAGRGGYKPLYKETGDTGDGLTVNPDPKSDTVTITINDTSGHNSIDIYYRFDCWNVVSGKNFTIECEVADGGIGKGATHESSLTGSIMTGNGGTIIPYATEWDESIYSFNGFGGADKKGAYILAWSEVYKTYFGLEQGQFDNANYIYDIAAYEVEPTGQQPYGISGTFTPDQKGELIGGVYMMDSAKDQEGPEALCVKIPGSEFREDSAGYSFEISNDSLTKVVSSLEDETDNKTYTLYFLVRYLRETLTGYEDVKDWEGKVIDKKVNLNGTLTLTHTGVDSGRDTRIQGEPTFCCYDGASKVDLRKYWATYYSTDVNSSAGLTMLKGGNTATVEYSADFFCLNEANGNTDLTKMVAIIDLSYLTNNGKQQLGKGDYRFSGFNLSLIDAKGTWSQNTTNTPNVGWTPDKYGTPSASTSVNIGEIKVYGSTSLTGNDWILVKTVPGADVWAKDQDRAFRNNFNLIEVEYVRLKVEYDCKYTTALRVGYQMELKPGIVTADLKNVEELTLTNWFNYGAYTYTDNGDEQADTDHFVFQRYPVDDSTPAWTNYDGTIKEVREYDNTSGPTSGLPGYNLKTESWDEGYSLRGFAKTTLKCSTDVAGMMVTQALYDSNGNLVGNPTSIDPTAQDSYSLKTEVANVSEIVYNISGAVTSGANSLKDLQEHIESAGEDSPYKSLTMRYYVLLPEGLKLNTNPDNGEKDENGAPKYHFWSNGTTEYLSANSAFYNNNSSKVVQDGKTDVPVSKANIPGWNRFSSNGWLSKMYWEAAGAVTHNIDLSEGQLVVFERTLSGYAWDQFNMWGNSTFFWGRGLSFSVVPANGTGTLPAGSYMPKFWCQFLDGNGELISLEGFAKDDDLETISGQAADTLLYIPCTFVNKHHQGGSGGEIEVDIEKGSTVALDDGREAVRSEGQYSYPLKYEVTKGTSTDVVLWCNVEEMSGHFKDTSTNKPLKSEWKGTVAGVDLNGNDGVQVYVKNGTFNAEDYASRKASKDWLTSTEGWTQVADLNNYDWSSVKAIAFYFAGKTFNSTDNKSATVSIKMNAPKDNGLYIGADDDPNKFPKEPSKDVYTAYNELLISDTHVEESSNEEENENTACYYANCVTVPIKVTPATYALPSTGGPGTILIYTTGMALVTAAAYLMYQTLRRGRKQGKGGAA